MSGRNSLLPFILSLGVLALAGCRLADKRPLITPPPRHTRISSGALYTLFLHEDAAIRGWGCNAAYQLGLEDNTIPYPDPVLISGLADASVINAALNNAFAVTEEGALYSWGENQFGMLGIGVADDPEKAVFHTPDPVRVDLPGVVFTSIRAGQTHAIALDAAGNVWTWGSNRYGELGVPGLENQNAPHRLDDGRLNGKVTGIAAGHFSSYALVDADGDGIGEQLYAWGDNVYGELGLGFRGGIVTAPTAVPRLANVVKMLGGNHRCAALKSDGTVWTWGRNDRGQLGLGHTDDTPVPSPMTGIASVVTDIACGYRHTLALSEDGALLAWGDNEYIQLGAGHDKLEEYYTVPQHVMMMTGVVAVEGGAHHSVALREDGTVWTWGSNPLGELGRDPEELPYTFVPLQVRGLD
ncbi:MAG: hypothetical protein JXD23_02250 [Spirochaetales bacterium]|nr:hypothetical protein [Spirochaetales bacterium]